MGANKLTSENLREKNGNKITHFKKSKGKNGSKITHLRKSKGKKWEQKNSPQKI